MARRKKYELADLPNLKMNSDTYALRRKVMDVIYDVKRMVPDLPRINVRITKAHERTLGRGEMGRGYVIWITEETAKGSALRLRHVTLHEILHTVYGVDHDETCPLMHPIAHTQSKAVIDRAFLKWVNRSRAIQKVA